MSGSALAESVSRKWRTRSAVLNGTLAAAFILLIFGVLGKGVFHVSHRADSGMGAVRETTEKAETKLLRSFDVILSSYAGRAKPQ